MKMKKIITAVIALCITLTVLVSCSEKSNTVNSAPLPEKTENNEAEGLTVNFPAPDLTGEIPSLPDELPKKFVETLNKRLDNQDFACAMYYYDLTTGFSISYNAERLFAAASLIKAPYVMYVLNMVNDGEVSVDKKFVYDKKKHYMGGTGQIRNMPDGSEFTLWQLIEFIVTDSDNIALKMLSYPDTGIMTILEFCDKAYKDYHAKFWSGTYGRVLHASGVGRMFTDLYKKAQDGNELYAKFLEMLKGANENKFIKGGLPKDEEGNSLYEVAHKYGEDIKSLNDAAVVFYKDRPYVLVILTDYREIYTMGFMNRISADIFRIHEYICNYSEQGE